MAMSIKKVLVDLEKQYWNAVKNKDIEKASILTDDPCLVAGSWGIARVDKKNFHAIMKAANYTLHEFALKETEVRLLNEDVAILAYKVHEELTVDGKPVSLDASEASTWVRRGDRWVCALHSESPAGDPYGRDRKLV